jgi:hypothetical protein
VLIFYASAECLLRLAALGIIILLRDNKALFKRRAQSSGGKALNQTPLSLDRWTWDSLEETMTRRLAVITLTLLFAAVCLTGRAEAGASASAPSKNTRVSAQQTNHQSAKNDIGITEYSSSSARGHSR